MVYRTLIATAAWLGLNSALALPLETQPDPTGAGAVLAPGGPSASVLAPSQQSGDEREPAPADLDEAIEIAQERYGGQAAGAETVIRDGRRVHEVRLLGEDGSVRTVRIDPRTGAIIRPRRR